jgi:TolB-like protein
MSCRRLQRSALSYCLLAALGSTHTALAQNAPLTVAILPFQDRGSYGEDKETFRALQLGIPATIASELRGHSELRLADADRIHRALPTREVSATTGLDAATAARVGKEAGARYAITGSFADFYGKIRLDARIIDTESGQIVKVVSNDPRQDDRSQLYRIIQAVGHKVLAAARPAGGPSTAGTNEERSIPTDALLQYSLGLLSEQEGHPGAARQHFERALAMFSDYPEAREGLTRVRSS